MSVVLDNVIIGDSYAQLRYDLTEYVKGCADMVESVRYIAPYEIKLKDGRRIIFVSEHSYPVWCKGRRYKLYGVEYHSGYPAKGEI